MSENYIKYQDFLITVICAMILYANFLVIGELKTLQMDLHNLNEKIETLDTVVKQLEEVSKAHSENVKNLKNTVNETSNTGVVTIGFISVLLIGGGLLYVFGFDPSKLGECFEMVISHTGSGFEDVHNLNTYNFTKIYECFGKNQEHIKEVTEMLSSQLKNISNSLLQLLTKSDLNSLQNSSAEDQ